MGVFSHLCDTPVNSLWLYPFYAFFESAGLQQLFTFPSFHWAISEREADRPPSGTRQIFSYPRSGSDICIRMCKFSQWNASTEWRVATIELQEIECYFCSRLRYCSSVDTKLASWPDAQTLRRQLYLVRRSACIINLGPVEMLISQSELNVCNICDTSCSKATNGSKLKMRL